ncbi:MAG: hypothetical protein WBC22_05845 [Sedimentisphaerales bacterium]
MKAVNTSLLCFSIILLWIPDLKAEVWGVKTKWSNPYSIPPSTLFHFSEDGSGFYPVAPITLDGGQIEVDGLAMSPNGILYGFQVGIGGSRLVMINKSNAETTLIGPILPSRDIRGGVISTSGDLIVLDSASNQIVQVDLNTGNEIGFAKNLILDGNPFILGSHTDIAQITDNSFIICSPEPEGYADIFYILNIINGQLSYWYNDPNPGYESGYGLVHSGLVFSPFAAHRNILFTFEANDNEDIYTYETHNNFSRTLLYNNIIPTYNSGYGDLATIPAQSTSECDNLWNIKWFHCDRGHDNDFALNRDGTPVCGSENCSGEPGSCWGEPLWLTFYNSNLISWSIGMKGELILSHAKDVQVYGDTYLYNEAPKTVTVPKEHCDVCRIWLNNTEVVPEPTNNFTLNLTEGWSHLEFTAYHQHDGAIFSLNYAFADNVDAMSRIPSERCESCPYIILGDLNYDCVVDLRDFALMAAHWLINCKITPEHPDCILK